MMTAGAEHALRRDPLTGQWVVFAQARSARPRESDASARDPAPEAVSPAHLSTCPLCLGNEDMTPSEIDRLAGDGAPNAWSVRVIPNLYPAFIAHDDATTEVSHPIFHHRPAVGSHEVLIETPDHTAAIPDLSRQQLHSVFLMYQRRFLALAAEPDIRAVTIFRNHTAAAGTSLVHPHSQIIASNVENPLIAQQSQVMREYFREHGECLLCRMVAEEQSVGKRIRFGSESVIALHPFASQWPYETWIVPRDHRRSFGAATSDERQAVARATQQSLSLLRDALNDPPFNFTIQTLLNEGAADEGVGAYHWHLRITPRITTPAGFELATGMMINSVFPEDAAATLRNVAAHHSDL